MMRKAPLFFVLLLCFVTGRGQNEPSFFKVFPRNTSGLPAWAALMYSSDPMVFQVDEQFRLYYRNHPFEKTIHTQNYKHWRWQVDAFLDADGHIRRPDPAEEQRREQRLEERLVERMARPRSATEWTSMGPFETYINGTLVPYSQHKNIYSIDQSQSDPDVLVCGTEAGGVYRSVDRGLNWTLINKNEVFAGGNEAVKIHPTDPQTILVASNQRIYRSTDAGLNWAPEHLLNGSGYEFKYHPRDHDTVFCAGSQGLFRSNDGGDNWFQVFSQETWDIDFHPLNPDTVFVLRHNGSLERAEVHRSYDAGNTWLLRDNGWVLPANPAAADDGGGKLAISPAAPDMVYACLIGQVKAGDEGWIGIYRSTDLGDSWVDADGQAGGPFGPINSAFPWNVAAYSGGYHQGFYNFDLEVSETDPGKLWVATIRLSESADSGRTFQSIGGANTTRLQYQHADVQDLEVNGNDIWVASDGGIDYSPNQLSTETSRKRGIHASHFWGFNVGWNEDVYVGGRYHDGTVAWYEGWGPGETHVPGGVEEPSGYVHPIVARKLMYRTHYASSNTSVVTVPEQLGGAMNYHADIPMYPNESYLFSRSSGLYFHPWYADHLFIGYGSSIWKSRNGGASFVQLGNLGTGEVFEIEIAPSDPGVIYAVFKPAGQACVIKKTTNGGLSWANTANPPGNRNQLEISVNPADADELWVGLGSGANGAKVYRTQDGGSTWQNMSSSVLNGETVRDVLFQGGTGGHVYLASLNTVFHYDPVAQTWSDYGSGLPLVAQCWAIRPFYRDGKLRMGSAGRGVWDRALADTNFVPLAQPVTYHDTSFCARDTVQFDCHSVLHHSGASWNWNISPAPVWISSATARNPRVVFGNPGSYDVSLTVTDRNNNSSTRNVPGMVTVLDLCQPDSVPGKALVCANQGDFGLVDGLPATSLSSYTISAWVFPDRIQDDYTGIVMADGVAAGFNFREGNNTLGYHAPNGAWWWDSNLLVPVGEWSHVAMSVAPNSVTLYVNGVPAVHNVNLNPADLSTLRIGSYQGWGSRNFDGLIDEVCIWTRSLSTDEVRASRHLTKEDLLLSDPSLIAYYQFNLQQNGRVPDNSGVTHLSLAGNSALEKSTAPVGGGTSAKENILFAGTYPFGSTGMEMDFAGTPPYPGGDVWVSRINLKPDSLPVTAAALNHYWIVNNYGPNAVWGAVDAVRFVAPGLNAQPAWLSNPGKMRLHYRRPDNAFRKTWTELCRAVQVDPSPAVFHFGDTCGIDRSGQFVVAADSAVISAAIGEPEVVTRPQVFPNPQAAGAGLQVRLPDGQSGGRFTLFARDGKTLGDWFREENQFSIPLPKGLAPGIYFYRIFTETAIWSGQVGILD